MEAGRLLCRSALLMLVVSLGVVMAVTYKRVVRSHWYALAMFEAAAVVAFVGTERKD